jgi:hypothetical protein
VRLNGRDVEDPSIGVDNVVTTKSAAQSLAINYHETLLSETWAIAELMVWDRFLSRAEILEAEQYLLHTLGWQKMPDRPLTLSFGTAKRTNLDIAAWFLYMGERDLMGRPTMTDVSGNGGIMETELALSPCLPGDNCLQDAYNTTPGQFNPSSVTGTCADWEHPGCLPIRFGPAGSIPDNEPIAHRMTMCTASRSPFLSWQ